MSLSNIQTDSTVVSPVGDCKEKILYDIIQSTSKSARIDAIRKAYDLWKKGFFVNDHLSDGAVPILIKQLVYVLHIEDEDDSKEEVYMLVQALESIHQSVPEKSIHLHSPVHSLLQECVNLLKKYIDPLYKSSDSNFTNKILLSTTNLISKLSRVNILYHDEYDSTLTLKFATELVTELLYCVTHSEDITVVINSIKAINNFLCMIPKSERRFNPIQSTLFSQVFWREDILKDVLSAIENLFSALLETSSDLQSISVINQPSYMNKIDSLYVSSSFVYNLATVLRSQNGQSPLKTQPITFLIGTSHRIMFLLSLCVLMKPGDSEPFDHEKFYRMKYNALNALLTWALVWMKFLHDLPFLNGIWLHAEKDCITCFTSNIIPYIIESYQTLPKSDVNTKMMGIQNTDCKENETHTPKKRKIANDDEDNDFLHSTMDTFLAKALEAVKLLVHVTKPRLAHLWTKLMSELSAVLGYDIGTYGVTFVETLGHLATLHSVTPKKFHSNGILHINDFLNVLEYVSSKDKRDDQHRTSCMLSWAYQRLSMNPTWLEEMNKHEGTISSIIYLLRVTTCETTSTCAAVALLNLAYSGNGKWNDQIENIVPVLLESALSYKEQKDQNIYIMIINILMQSAEKNEKFCSFLMSKKYAQKVVMIFSQAVTPPDPIVVGANTFLKKLLQYI